VTGDPEVWLIVHNLVWVGYHIRQGMMARRAVLLGQGGPTRTMEELVLEDPGAVLPLSFAAVVAEMMVPYEGRI
jgi:hypothetical protein